MNNTETKNTPIVNKNENLTHTNSAIKQTLNRPLRLFIGTISNDEKQQKKTLKIDKKKIGHREIKDGVVHYKKVPTDELKKSIQFGIVHFINERNRDKMDRDLLMQDFQVVENIVFPRAGSQCTPAHDFNDFKLKVYAPYGFKYLRRKFNLNEVDFMVSFFFLVC